jgi:hypothetical protein
VEEVFEEDEADEDEEDDEKEEEALDDGAGKAFLLLDPLF